MKKHPTWKLVKEYLGWDGGTIHQVSKAVKCSTELLLAEPGDVCEVRLGYQWHSATFVSLDGFPMGSLDLDGIARPRRANFTAFVPGAFSKGLPRCNLPGLRGGENIRMPSERPG